MQAKKFISAHLNQTTPRCTNLLNQKKKKETKTKNRNETNKKKGEPKKEKQYSSIGDVKHRLHYNYTYN